MSSIKDLKIELLGVGNALQNKMFSVPIYQRSYSWEDKQVQDLLNDINSAIENGESEYFLGSVVVTKKGKRFEIVDGQQRIVTITMIIAAIRDYFIVNNDNERANAIESQYLFFKELKTLKLVPKVKLNLIDNQFFLDKVLSNTSGETSLTEASKHSHSNIEDAVKLIKREINKIGDKGDPNEGLISLIDFISERLKVIWVSVADEANAFVIFETLNDRGLSLAITDLLKNYLFGLSGNRIDEIQSNWINLNGILEASSSNADIAITWIILDIIGHQFMEL